MGPEKNSALFEAVAKSRLDIIKNDYIRRELLVGVLEELSELFEDKDNTSHPVTEPNLLPRLYAVSMVQKSPMGIAGFEPMLAISDEQPNGNVDAKAAPHHDEFVIDNSVYRTRLINITFPFHDYGSLIEVFGINLYQPSIEELSSDTESNGSGIIIVGHQGHVKRPEEPITGETLVFAVRNKETNDAKVYTVGITTADNDEFMMVKKGISYQTDTKATVFLPDGRSAKIELLQDELFGQVLDELAEAAKTLQAVINPDSRLTPEQRTAAAEALSHIQED